MAKMAKMTKVDSIYNFSEILDEKQKIEGGFKELLDNGYEDDMKTLFCNITNNDWEMLIKEVEEKDLKNVKSKIVGLGTWQRGALFDNGLVEVFEFDDGLWTVIDDNFEFLRVEE